MMIHILMSWFKESKEKRKTKKKRKKPKETVENGGLHKAVSKETMTTQE